MANNNPGFVTDEYAQNIPNTQARTAPSIQLFVKNEQQDSNWHLIGAIMSFDKNISRNMTRRVSLSSPVPGMTMEIIPGALTNFSITIKRAMLNSSSMIEALGFSGVEDLIRTNTALTIREVRYARTILNGVTAITHQILEYNSCFLKSYPTTVSIDGDWIVIQDCELEVANVTVAADDSTVVGATGTVSSGLEV